MMPSIGSQRARQSVGKLCLVLMGRVMLNKSLIPFSVDGWSCVPSLLFNWGQPMVHVIKIMVTSPRKSHVCTATLSVLNPVPGHHKLTPSLETPRLPQASPGQSPVRELLLSPGSCCTRFCCALQVTISQSYVISGSSMVSSPAVQCWSGE